MESPTEASASGDQPAQPDRQAKGSDGEPFESILKSRSRRGFAVAAAAALGVLAGWRWLMTRNLEQGIPWPLRRALEFNERIGEALYDPQRLADEFARSKALTPRVNGAIGINPGIDLANWRLRVIGQGGDARAKQIGLEEIRSFPRVEMTTELKCIEGWSTIVHWAGARLVDLVSQTRLADRNDAGDLFPYVSMTTPDAAYYTGLDRESALHPQTLLAYEMNGLPLTLEHGAPLRLVIPVKYGIKSIKQLGTIRFTDERPADYWAERGYDWYAGH